MESDDEPWDPEELRHYHDGHGLLSMQITKTNANIVFYDIFGRALHRWSISKELKKQWHRYNELERYICNLFLMSKQITYHCLKI